jgi:hypothetical protein
MFIINVLTFAYIWNFQFFFVLLLIFETEWSNSIRYKLIELTKHFNHSIYSTPRLIIVFQNPFFSSFNLPSSLVTFHQYQPKMKYNMILETYTKFLPQHSIAKASDLLSYFWFSFPHMKIICVLKLRCY